MGSEMCIRDRSSGPAVVRAAILNGMLIHATVTVSWTGSASLVQRGQRLGPPVLEVSSDIEKHAFHIHIDDKV